MLSRCHIVFSCVRRIDLFGRVLLFCHSITHAVLAELVPTAAARPTALQLATLAHAAALLPTV